MLGVCLLFVGIVLINNGMCSLYNVDGKSTAIMNIFTGGLSLFINFVIWYRVIIMQRERDYCSALPTFLWLWGNF